MQLDDLVLSKLITCPLLPLDAGGSGGSVKESVRMACGVFGCCRGITNLSTLFCLHVKDKLLRLGRDAIVHVALDYLIHQPSGNSVA